MNKCKYCQKTIWDSDNDICEVCEIDIFNDEFSVKCEYHQEPCDKNNNTPNCCTHKDNIGTLALNLGNGIKIKRCFMPDCPTKVEFYKFMKDL